MMRKSKKLKQFAKKVKNVVITDFGHGLITKKISNSINNLKVEKFINCQANHLIMVLTNLQNILMQKCFHVMRMNIDYH